MIIIANFPSHSSIYSDLALEVVIAAGGKGKYERFGNAKNPLNSAVTVGKKFNQYTLLTAFNCRHSHFNTFY